MALFWVRLKNPILSFKELSMSMRELTKAEIISVSGAGPLSDVSNAFYATAAILGTVATNFPSPLSPTLYEVALVYTVLAAGASSFPMTLESFARFLTVRYQVLPNSSRWNSATKPTVITSPIGATGASARVNFI